MINKIIIALLFSSNLITIAHSASAQTSIKPNTVYFELGGCGLFTSIQYERQILKNIRLNLHTGIGFYGLNPTYVTLPISINYLFRINKSNSYIDLGAAATYSKANVTLYAIVDRKEGYKQTNFWNFVPYLSYRYYNKNNFMYRFSLSPVINQYELIPFVGFSIGKNF